MSGGATSLAAPHRIAPNASTIALLALPRTSSGICASCVSRTKAARPAVTLGASFIASCPSFDHRRTDDALRNVLREPALADDEVLLPHGLDVGHGGCLHGRRCEQRFSPGCELRKLLDDAERAQPV